MSIVVNQISSFKVFNKEIHQPLLDLVPSSFIKKATDEINRALLSNPVQKSLQNKKITELQYEILDGEIIIHIGDETIKARIKSDPFHRIYEFLTRINMAGENPLLHNGVVPASRPFEDEDSDSNLSSGSNVFSIIRNALSINPLIGPTHISATALGSFSGIFSVILGIRLMSYANHLRNTSEEIEDTDGIYRSNLLSLNAVNLSALGVSFFVEKTYQTLVDSKGGTFLGALIIPLYIMVSTLSVIFGSYCLYKNNQFAKELNVYHENKDLTEKNRLKAALAFLKDSLQPTALEKWNITQLVNKTVQNPQDQQAKVAKKIDQLIQRKKTLLERSTDADTVKQLENFDFQKLYSEDSETVQKAKEICQKAIDINTKKNIYLTIKLLASVVSLAAAIFFAITPIIAIPATLVIVSSLIHLLTNHQKTFDFIASHLLNVQGSVYSSLFSENGAASI